MNLAPAKTPLTEVQESIIDVLRTVLMVNIAIQQMRKLVNSDLPLPPGMNANVIQKTIDTMDRFTRESKRTIGKTGNYLDRLPQIEYIENVVVLNDMLFRIGIEQNDAQYEEFYGMLLDMVDAVFYAQAHRKNMNFPKYRKLCELITDEIKADVNRTPNQVQYYQGELFFKSVPPVHEPKIK